MNTLESQLAHRLHDMVDGEFDSTPPGDAVLGRGRRAGRRRATAIAATASLAVVAAGGVTVAVAQPWGDHHPAPVGRAQAAQAPAPRLRLAAAITASQNISYRVKVTERWGPGSATTTEGAFDPGADTGYLNSTWAGAGVTYQERLVDGVLFDGSSGSTRWKQEPGRHDRLDYDSNLSGTIGASADPEQLFGMLRQAGATITQTGTDSYHFVVNTAEDSVASAYSGDVTTGAGNRIAKVAYELTTRASKDGKSSTEHNTVTVTLSDYGAPVTVERPANPVIVK